MKRVTMLAALIGMLLTAASRAEDPAPLVLEAKIPLGAVTGRIDHFAFDADRQLLFVAELGNDSVGVVDVKERKVLRRLSALKEPQGVAYHAATSTLYVANAGDGSVRLFQGPDFTSAGRIELGDDAGDRLHRFLIGAGRRRHPQPLAFLAGIVEYDAFDFCAAEIDAAAHVREFRVLSSRSPARTRTVWHP